MIKPTQALRRRHFRALYGPISGARQCCGPLDPGALSGVMWLPHGPQSPNKPVTSAPWGPGKPGKATRSQASASSTASLSPCARHPRPRPRRLRRPRGRCSPETRSQPALQQPPGRASPTFSGQEGGRPRAFPVVQPKRAETSLHSHSLGCQRTEAKVQPPPGRTERGSPGSPLCPGRGPAPGARTAAGSGEPSWHLGRAPPPPRPASLAQGFLRAGALPWCPGAGGSTCLARVS